MSSTAQIWKSYFVNHNVNLSRTTLPKFHIMLLEFVDLAAMMIGRSSLGILAEGKP